MKVAVIRERLQRFIETAEEKKLLAIYTLVENEITEQERWEDESFVAEMEGRYQNYKSGNSKPLSLDEVEDKARKSAKRK
ncbi:MAG: hypothetical protein H6550_12110 [Chitinophagales bacterium]|nr:hypothetical protein [Chitinophagales bacterium]